MGVGFWAKYPKKFLPRIKILGYSFLPSGNYFLANLYFGKTLEGIHIPDGFYSQ